MKWTTKEMAELIGRPVMVPVGDMQMEAVVEDAAQQYRRLRLLVKPPSGTGSSGVENWEPTKVRPDGSE